MHHVTGPQYFSVTIAGAGAGAGAGDGAARSIVSGTSASGAGGFAGETAKPSSVAIGVRASSKWRGPKWACLPLDNGSRVDDNAMQ